MGEHGYRGGVPGPGRLPIDATAPARASGSRTLRSIVVVGAGLAGARTVLELRTQGFDGHVTVLGAEGVAPYDRPPLSKHLLDRPAPAWLSDELGVDALALADDVRLASPATGLRLLGAGPADGVGTAGPAGTTDPGTGVEVRTADDVVTADAVVVATGAAAVRPAAWPSALALHTAADAARLRAALRPGAGAGAAGTTGATGTAGAAGLTRLVIIGAGWIGAEIATVATAAGVQVTVVEARETPLITALGPRVGALTAPWFAHAGVALHTGVAVATVAEDAVTLVDGTVIPADVVLAAVGARPATGWLAGALRLDADGSVPVDEWHAPVDGPWRVRVVGDAARRRSRRHGWVPGGHWDTALRGPADAVAGLLGTDHAGHPAPTEAPDLAPYVFSTQFGHELALYGSPSADDDLLLRGDPAGDGWSALWFAPGTDRLTGVFAVDRPRDVGGARRLFSGADLPVLDRARAADPAVPLPATARG